MQSRRRRAHGGHHGGPVRYRARAHVTTGLRHLRDVSGKVRAPCPLRNSKRARSMDHNLRAGHAGARGRQTRPPVSAGVADLRGRARRTMLKRRASTSVTRASSAVLRERRVQAAKYKLNSSKKLASAHALEGGCWWPLHRSHFDFP